MKFIAASKGLVKIQQGGGGAAGTGQPKRHEKAPEMKLVFRADWATATARLKGARGFLSELAGMAEKVG